MTLLELCEPLLQYVCRLNRSARKGGQFEHSQVSSEIEGMFSEILSKAASDPVLAGQLDKDKGKIELVLAFFVDFMIKESSLSFAADWKEIAADRYNELTGDEKFWDMLDEALAERGEAATDRIAVYYTCIGLGFTGWYAGQPEYLRKKMVECCARLRSMIDVDDSSPIISESELYVNNDDLIEPPGTSLVGIGIASVVLMIVLLIGNIYLYYQGTSELTQSLNDIISLQAPATSGDTTPLSTGRSKDQDNTL